MPDSSRVTGPVPALPAFVGGSLTLVDGNHRAEMNAYAAVDLHDQTAVFIDALAMMLASMMVMSPDRPWRRGDFWVRRGFAGAPHMAAYSASKAFDMVFAEALWCELQPRGVDVLGLILGETDTPALRRLRFERGLSKRPDQAVKGAETPQDVVDDALAHLRKGPTRLANRKMRRGLRLLYPFSRNFVVALMARASEKIMGKTASTAGG